MEFQDGNRHGRTRRWDKDGNIELDLLFEKGEPIDPSATTSSGDGFEEPVTNEKDVQRAPDGTPTDESAPAEGNS